MPNAPTRTPVSCVGGLPGEPLVTWENGRIAADRGGRDGGCTAAATAGGACRGVRYFTGRWYATRYRSAGITTSAVSTGRPEAK